MIVSGLGVAGTVAESARASLDKEINKLRAEGRLEAGKKTLEKLKWTPETFQAAQEFEKVYLAPRPHASTNTNHYRLLTSRS